ncbi:hypothetical protein Gohar_025232 [Gossypium harknessii]|uniref:Uncharacterized protein n=1 Tax=Gossypium harknessii TaxID=34285 RepID=A0A7J9HIE0_9ROSI|nr:hypothetical protein [Gossypium harknessii]
MLKQLLILLKNYMLRMLLIEGILKKEVMIMDAKLMFP